MEAARLAGWDAWPEHVRDGWQRRIDKARAHWERKIDRARRKVERHEARARERAGRHDWTGPAQQGLPWPVLPIALLGLTIAMIAVTIALRVIVPTVLTVLSIVFGPSLRRAAIEVSQAGRRAGGALDQARSAVRGELSSPYMRAPSSPSRRDDVASMPPPRVRVAPGVEQPLIETNAAPSDELEDEATGETRAAARPHS
jgi:hypothetical protein